MAIQSLQPTPASANPLASVIIIPTPFALACAAITACADEAQLARAGVEARRAGWDMSAWAHMRINRALRERFAEIREARS